MPRFGERHITEILTKENERYRLMQLGFFADIAKECELATMLSPAQEDETDFALWKSRILREYYRAKGFSSFCKEHLSDPEFERMIQSVLYRHVETLRKNSERTETDTYLAADNDSVSYSLPQDIFQDIYSFSFPNFPAIGNTSELEKICSDMANEHFPLPENLIIEKMKLNHSLFWEKFYIKLKSIAAGFCYKMSGISGENNFHDIWSDTCLTVNSAVTGDKIKYELDAKAIISYAVGILKNKNRELGRSKKRQGADIESIQYRLTAEDEDNYFNNPVTVPENFMSHNLHLATYVDYEDEDSKRGYFIVILYNKEHPLHETLIKGLEDKVERLMEHYVDGISYEDMAVRHFGEKSEKELTTICAKLRQESKRLKEKLYSRYLTILKDYR